MEAHSSLTINALPTEVLDKIFSYLTFYDVKAVKIVCRRWLNITLHSSYTRHIKINIRNFKILPPVVEQRDDSRHQAESTVDLSFVYQTVKLNYKDYAHSEFDEYEQNVKLFMKFNGDNVKNLTLIDFHATKEPRLYKLCGEIVDAAPNLERLCLTNTQFDRRLFLNENGETNRGAQNLKHLSLVPWSLRLVEYEELEFVENNCPNLQGLTWLNAHAAFDDKVLAFFRSMSGRLKKLKIHNLVAEELIREKNFSILNDFHLVSLDMKFDTSVVSSVMFARFVEFIKSQKHTLTDLTMYCSDVMVQHLGSVYSALPKLERLKIVYDGVNIVDLTTVLSQPRELKVLQTYVNMPNDFSNVQPAKNNLNLLNCNVCASAQLLNVVNNFTSLVALRVTLFTLPAVNVLSAFYGSLSQLKYLYIEINQRSVPNSNENQLDTPSQHNVSHLKRLECLGILTKEKTYIPGCEFEHITKLKCLQKLICKVRVKPSDACFDEFFENSKSLNYLDVRQSDGIDDDAVERIFRNLNHLSYMGLSGCVNILDGNAALDKVKTINNRVKYNDFPEDFDEDFILKYMSM